ncbi:hypothetical protein TsFJ059_005029 [Trichoderma semiorbis]|uniref:Uncharacterized protein n=1 Tax=Trichoderma semiorbis TaxID=1491008 RepID=A0A9P8KX74_9HYPO|nr:hypothetical protein TsFJ059_005029 [Trichoderma semiorbis]
METFKGQGQISTRTSVGLLPTRLLGFGALPRVAFVWFVRRARITPAAICACMGLGGQWKWPASGRLKFC